MEIHQGKYRNGISEQCRQFTTIEYEMALEDETIEKFNIRVPKPKFRCGPCWEKHKKTLLDRKGKRNAVVRGRPIAGFH